MIVRKLKTTKTYPTDGDFPLYSEESRKLFQQMANEGKLIHRSVTQIDELTNLTVTIWLDKESLDYWLNNPIAISEGERFTEWFKNNPNFSRELTIEEL